MMSYKSPVGWRSRRLSTPVVITKLKAAIKTCFKISNPCKSVTKDGLKLLPFGSSIYKRTILGAALTHGLKPKYWN